MVVCADILFNIYVLSLISTHISIEYKIKNNDDPMVKSTMNNTKFKLKNNTKFKLNQCPLVIMIAT